MRMIVWVFCLSHNMTPLLHFLLQMRERCYLMKQVLNFTLEEVLLPQSDRFQPLMQEVVPFLARLSNKLRHCVSSSPSQVHPVLAACLPSFFPPSIPPPRLAATGTSASLLQESFGITDCFIFLEFMVIIGSGRWRHRSLICSWEKPTQIMWDENGVGSCKKYCLNVEMDALSIGWWREG